MMGKNEKNIEISIGMSREKKREIKTTRTKAKKETRREKIKETKEGCKLRQGEVVRRLRGD